MNKRVFIFLLVVTFVSCNRQKSVDLNLKIPADLKMIGHKGSGPMYSFGNEGILDNSWEGISQAMNTIDGSEVDIQLSKDKTLWLFHDIKIKTCADTLINFSLLSNTEIREISHCKYQGQIISLEDFLTKAKNQSWKGKILCFDMKLLFNPEAIALFSSDSDFTRFIKQQIIEMTKLSKFDYRFEVFTKEQYVFFNASFPTKTYLVDHEPTRQNILKGKQQDIHLSTEINYTYRAIKDTSLTIDDLWVINYPDELLKALRFQPEIIQGDNLPMLLFFKKIQQGKKPKLQTTITQNIHRSTEEFISFSKKSVDARHSAELWEFSTNKKITSDDDYLLAITAVNEEDSTVFWDKIRFDSSALSSKIHFFINPKFLAYLGAKHYSITLWNAKKKVINEQITVNVYSF